MGKKSNLLLIFILLLAVFIRLGTLSKLMVFTPDEEYLLYISQTLIKHLHIIWIGVSALGLDFYMGPFWIYFITPFVALVKGDPLVIGFITSLFGVGAVFLLYLLGRRIFSEKVGLTAAVIYASSALLIYYDQQPYPPAVPFLSLLLLLLLYLTKYSAKWWIIFAVGYGMIFHIHLSLTLIILVAVYWAIVNRKTLSKKIIFLALFAFILTISPLIAFDYFHKGSNITAPIRIIQASKGHQIDFATRFNHLSQALSRVWYLDSYKSAADEILYPCTINLLSTTTKGNWVITLITTVLFIYFFARKKLWKDTDKRLLLIFSLVFLVPFTILPIINPIEYYLLGFFPVLILVVVAVLSYSNKAVGLMVYALITFLVLRGLFTVVTASGNFGLNNKKVLIGKVMNIIGDSSYDLAQQGQCHRYEGWRYLFSVYGRKPERSDEDQTFSWLYPTEVSKVVTKYSVVVQELRTSDDQTGYKYLLQSGGFEVFIFEH